MTIYSFDNILLLIYCKILLNIHGYNNIIDHFWINNIQTKFIDKLEFLTINIITYFSEELVIVVIF